jgi:radical SAM-linked protein
MEPGELVELANAQMPEGVVLYNARLVSPRAPSIAASVTKIKWRLDPASTGREFSPEELRERIDGFMAKREIPFTKERKGKVRRVNMRDFVDSVELREDGQVELTLNVLRELQIRATQVAQELLELSPEQTSRLKVKKTRNIFPEP